MGKGVKVVNAGDFDSSKAFYTKVQNATIHPLVSFFYGMSIERIISRYLHLNPSVQGDYLKKIFRHEPAQFRWAGCDLFYVIETNSCPSGQKSMPLISESDETGGYGALMENTFQAVVKAADERPDSVKDGVLAVIYDKNGMEAFGYATTMADVMDEPVYMAEFYEDDEDADVRWQDGVMQLRTAPDTWVNVRVCFRYVTQKPWRRFPVVGGRTAVLNPVLACLAGGRNKLVAAKAYEFFNAKAAAASLEIRSPETIRDVTKSEVPLWVGTLGGKACVKNPYSNAGQGVYTITSPEELQKFMDMDTGNYDQYIVQSLVGDYEWSSSTRAGQYYHVGTVPNKNGKIFCADVRMMVSFDYSKGCWRPLALYSRRAEKPLTRTLAPGTNSWEQLGTNLSYKTPDGKWDTDTNRLMIMDRKDFNQLGIGIDDLIDAFVQTVLCAIAIDDLACSLTRENDRALPPPTDAMAAAVAAASAGAAPPLAKKRRAEASAVKCKLPVASQFDADLFYSLNKDAQLSGEIMMLEGTKFDNGSTSTPGKPSSST